MNFIHTFFKWGWCMGCTIAVMAIYFHWLLELEPTVLAVAAACVLFALSCAIGELCLTLGDLNDDSTT